jgi:type IV secretion system protein VirB2
MFSFVTLQRTKYGTFCGVRRNFDYARLFYMFLFLLILGSLFVVLGETTAEAGTANADIPWENPLELITKSLTGPVTKSLCLIMIVVSVGVLIFGGDLSGWARSVTFMTLAAGILGGANSFLNIFGVSGAII